MIIILKIVIITTSATITVIIKGQVEWFKIPGNGVLALPSWVKTTRTTPGCLNTLVLAWYSRKGNGNSTWSSQSASYELLITDFGCFLSSSVGTLDTNVIQSLK